MNAFVRDLTTSKQSEARFRALLESAPDAMVITDEAGVVTLANQQAERLFGYSREEFVGLGVDILLPPRFRAGHAVHRRAYSADPQSRAMGIGLDLRVSPGLARLTKSPTLSTRRTPVPR